MIQKKAVSSILIGVGIVILLVSIFADLIGMGAFPGFGYKQVIGTIVGIVLVIIGVLLHRK